MWYSNSLLLSYNKIFNFLIGNRGGGKSFDNKRWVISSFIKSNYTNQFVWVRRYKSELKNVTHMFDDIISHFPNNEIEIKGNICYVDKKICGYFVALSTTVTIKSTSFPNVDKIIYDEFLVEKGSQLRYLSCEVETFLGLCETIGRHRDNIRVVFIANNTSLTNPYFTYFNIKPDIKKRFNVYENILIEYFTDSEFIEMKNNTKFGKLIKNTKFADYSVDNKILNLNDSKLIELTNISNPWLTINYKNENYGVWFDSGKLIFSLRYDKNNLRKLNLEIDNHENEGEIVKKLSQNRFTLLMKKYYVEGNFYFNCIHSKAVCMDIFTKLW